MSTGGALVNLGDLSKPATVLIEKISDAIGAVFEPHQIKRVARAEAEAEKIRAVAQIEISEIQQRALIRMIQEEGRKQENIENISAKAIGGLDPDAKPENVEKDWLAHFFEKAKLISDTEMQSLWSSLLAGEANRPGTFSKRTVELIATLDKADAHLFTKLCGFGWMIGNVAPLIFETKDDIYANQELTFNSLTHLDSLGLIRFESLSGFVRQRFPKKATLFYFGTPLIVEFPKESDNDLPTGKVMLTQAGQELAPICGAKRIETFPEYVVGKWAEFGITVYSEWPNKRFQPTGRAFGASGG